jgi:hypothetical protein
MPKGKNRDTPKVGSRFKGKAGMITHKRDQGDELARFLISAVDFIQQDLL